MAEHRAAFEYDWRTRFNLPLSEVGDGMSWGEALRLTERLRLDPSSHAAAALSGWLYPVGDLAVRDVFDLMSLLGWRDGGKKGPRPKPYPRPTDPPPKVHGGERVEAKRIRAIFDAHTEPDD